MKARHASYRRILFALAALALVFAAGVAAARWRRRLSRRASGRIDLAASREGSTIVVDRDGRLMRPFTLPDGRWRLPATTHDVDPRYLAMLVAYEDGRFYEHRGVDARALFARGRGNGCGAAMSSPAARRSRCRSRG